MCFRCTQINDISKITFGFTILSLCSPVKITSTLEKIHITLIYLNGVLQMFTNRLLDCDITIQL